MSVEYCRVHDRPVDTDFELHGCVRCERSADWEIDMTLAEAKFTSIGCYCTPMSCTYPTCNDPVQSAEVVS